MGFLNLISGSFNRKPMSVPGDDFHSTVAPNGDLVSRYTPADSTDKYTQVRRKKRVIEYHSYDIQD